MRKQLFYTFIVFVYIWSWSIFNAVSANERLETTTGHIIVETVKGSDIDQMKVLEGELENLSTQVCFRNHTYHTGKFAFDYG